MFLLRQKRINFQVNLMSLMSCIFDSRGRLDAAGKYAWYSEKVVQTVSTY